MFNIFNKQKKGIIPKEYIFQRLPIDPVIVEAGAHIGNDSIEMAKINKNSRIYAFEPVPHIYEQLKKNTQKYSNIKCLKYAISPKNRIFKMYVSSGDSDASSSLLKPKDHLKNHPKVFFDKEITVKGITIDSFVKKINKNVDLFWFDLQGLEPSVISVSETIKNSILVYTEVSLKELYEGSILYDDLKKIMERKGFEILREELPWDEAGNVLFVNKRYVQKNK